MKILTKGTDTKHKSRSHTRQYTLFDCVASFFAGVLTLSSVVESGFDRIILGGRGDLAGDAVADFVAAAAVPAPGLGDERRGAPRLMGSGGGPVCCLRGVDRRCMLRSMSVRLRRVASPAVVDFRIL